MASNKNPFLDDLFPDPMRARKARIFKGFEKVSNTAAFRFSALSSKVKAEGVVDRRAEVMFRFGQANIKSYLHTIKAADYIARNGDIELIDQSGNCLQGKAEYRKVLYEWKLLSEMGDRTSRQNPQTFRCLNHRPFPLGKSRKQQRTRQKNVPPYMGIVTKRISA